GRPELVEDLPQVVDGRPLIRAGHPRRPVRVRDRPLDLVDGACSLRIRQDGNRVERARACRSRRWRTEAAAGVYFLAGRHGDRARYRSCLAEADVAPDIDVAADHVGAADERAADSLRTAVAGDSEVAAELLLASVRVDPG